MKQKILLPALLAAMLVIAGCGGGNSTGGDPGGGDDEGLSDLRDAITAVLALDRDDTNKDINEAIAELNRAKDAYDGTDPNNLAEAERHVGVLEGIVMARDTAKDSDLLNALQTAVSALETLSAGDDKEGSALKMVADAMKKTNAVGALGSSAVVEKYGNAILKARDDLQKALDKAKAEQAKVTGDLASGSAGKELRENAKSAIEAAEDLLADGKTPGVTRGDLAKEVAAYEGEGNTPAEKASDVAKAVFGLLDDDNPFSDNTDAADLDMAKIDKTAFAMGNTAPSGVVKFADIFGTEKNQTGNTALSLEGKPESSVVLDDNSPIAAINDRNGVSARYLGISGMLFCYVEATCKAPADGATFGAGWHFVPTTASGEDDNQYVVNNGEYEQAHYVEWGLWLTSTEANGLNNFVGQGQGSDALITANMSSAAHTSDTSGVTTATYKGAAAGLSARITGGEGTTASPYMYASGHFKADVELKAVFRTASPMLSGTIGGFESADPDNQGTAHVDTNWKIALTKSLTVGSLASEIADLGTLGNGAEVRGAWTANAYRKTAVPTDAADAANDHHPDAFFGRFNARFYGDDVATVTGAAAGNYHAEKE